MNGHTLIPFQRYGIELFSVIVAAAATAALLVGAVEDAN